MSPGLERRSNERGGAVVWLGRLHSVLGRALGEELSGPITFALLDRSPSSSVFSSSSLSSSASSSSLARALRCQSSLADSWSFSSSPFHFLSAGFPRSTTHAVPRSTTFPPTIIHDLAIPEWRLISE